uniref:ubiquitinyl hydrolase 1 n=1 Tax=Chinchilla lanigera TaxID=34839 RepID=A0A8C2V3N7_CHILA
VESIFHEKQEGSLCPVELSSIAHQLDEEERMRMVDGGVTSEDYGTFLLQPSGNMDDSGFFSIQVISNALKVWGLELICSTHLLSVLIIIIIVLEGKPFSPPTMCIMHSDVFLCCLLWSQFLYYLVFTISYNSFER